MSELIVNGYFETGELDPWRACADNELGESWICLEDDEPAFPRTRWVYSPAPELTDAGPLFLSDDNLRLTGNAGVTQTLADASRASGDFSAWVHCTPPDRAAGEFYACVCHTDHTFTYTRVTRGDLRRGVGPTKVTVGVRDEPVAKVVMCVVGADAPWYVSGISLPGVDAKGLSGLIRPGRYLENRVALLEQRVEQLAAIIASGPGHGRKPPFR